MKTWIVLAMMVLMIISISAFEFDNYKQYNEETKTATIKNSFGLGRTIAEVQLKTPQKVHVIAGEDRLIAEFEITSYEDYDNVFRDMELYYKQDMKVMNRGFTYKYWVFDGYDDVPIYKTDCPVKDSFENCVTYIDGSWQRPRYIWKDLESTKLSTLKTGVYKIGLFLDEVKLGEHGEWIPTLFSERIPEWAEWEEGWSTDLIVYYKLNETSGTMIDWVGNANMTNSGMNQNSAGKIGAGVNGAGNGDDATTAATLGLSNDMSICLWYNSTQANGFLAGEHAGGTTGNWAVILGHGGGYFKCGNSDNIESKSDSATNDGAWHFSCCVFDDGNDNVSVYVDGVIDGSMAEPDTLQSGAHVFRIGDEASGAFGFEGNMDEVAVWDRALTANEINDLYDSGTGSTYSAIISYPNITVTAVSSYNDVTINVFNLTSNVTGFHSETGGSLDTNDFANGTEYEHIVVAKGFTNVTNSSVINDWEASMTPDGFSGLGTNLDYTNSYVGSEIEITCNYTDDMGYGVNLMYWINNTDDSSLVNQSSNNYTLLSTDFNDTLDFWCEIDNDYYGENSSSNSLNGIDMQITINANDYLGVLLDAVNVSFPNFTISYTSNPITAYLTDFTGGADSNNTHINIVDLNYLHQNYSSTINFNTSVTEYNISLEPNKLTLNFMYQNGSAQNTEGQVAHLGGTYNFSDTSVIAIQQNLSVGVVQVVIGLQGGENWTQYYEYYNDYETHVSEDIWLMDRENADYYTYFRIMDIGNSPIENAQIRASCQEPSATEQNYSLIGQRLSSKEGYNFFIVDSNLPCLVTVLADGYTAYQRVYRLGDETATTEATAIPINLESSATSVDDGVWVYVPESYTNISENLKGVIVAPSKDQVAINTQYRRNQGFTSYQVLNEDLLNRYFFTLSSGTHYSSSSAEDIQLLVYTDGSLTSNKTVRYVDDRTDILDLPSLDSSLLNVILGIVIIIISALVGMMFTSASIGVTAFMVLNIFAVAIVASSRGTVDALTSVWMILALVSGIYVVLTLIKRILKE